MRATTLAFAALLGCSQVHTPAAPPPVTVDRTIHGDTRFDPMERIIVETASKRWYRFTSGRARLAIVWDYDKATYLELADSPHLIRTPSDVAPPGIGGRVQENEIRIVATVCPELLSCVMHEFGHFIGLQHVAGDRSVMSERNPVSEFSPRDRDQCVSHGLCEQ